jgi:serine/threonine protein kinase
VLSDLRKGQFPPNFLKEYLPVADFIRWMMDANPDNRPTATEILAAIAQHLEEGVRTPPPLPS